MEDNSLCAEQIYNADETGLFFKMLPDRTLAMKNDARKTEGGEDGDSHPVHFLPQEPLH